jgi:dienelactone hydrolase
LIRRSIRPSGETSYVRLSNPYRAFLPRATAALVAAALLAVVGLGYVVLRRSLGAELPPPDGSYGVGRASFEWVDSSRIDPIAPRPGTSRELAIWLWYPTPAVPGAQPAPYAPGAWAQLQLSFPLGLCESRLDRVRTHSIADAPIAVGRFPVVIMLPGLGFSAPQYASFAENLASHGYLVAGITPTYSANVTVLHGGLVRQSPAGNPSAFEGSDLEAARTAGNQLVQVWADDAIFAATRVVRLDADGPFAHHIDSSRTAYVGHSFGGAASLEACRRDPRCVGAVDLDGTPYGPVVRGGLKHPFMIIGSADSCVPGACENPATAADRADLVTARSVLAQSTGASWRYRIVGSRHFNFSDYSAYYLALPVRSLLALGPIDGGRALMIVNSYLVAFLDHAARSGPTSLLDADPPPFSEVRVLRS